MALLSANFRMHQTFVFTPVDPTGVVLVGLGLLNALVEEAVWRGACLYLLLKSRVHPVLAVAVQSLSFGLAHLVGGFPGGWVGVALTGVFGVSQGYLASRTRSLVLPVLVHAWLDVVIGIHVLS